MKKYIKRAEKKHICSICGRTYEGYGNNAEPVNDGRCCDWCNMRVVIRTRIKFMQYIKEYELTPEELTHEEIHEILREIFEEIGYYLLEEEQES